MVVHKKALKKLSATTSLDKFSKIKQRRRATRASSVTRGPLNTRRAATGRRRVGARTGGGRGTPILRRVTSTKGRAQLAKSKAARVTKAAATKRGGPNRATLAGKAIPSLRTQVALRLKQIGVAGGSIGGFSSRISAKKLRKLF